MPLTPYPTPFLASASGGHMAQALLVLGLIYFLSHLLSASFRWTRLPDVLVLVLIGIAAGPVLSVVHPSQFGAVGQVLTTVALTVMLFESGTTLRLDDIARTAPATLMMTFGSAGLTVAVGAVVFHFFAAGGTSWLLAFVFGAVISGTSATVVIPMVRNLQLRQHAGTTLILESALTDVTSIVLAVALVHAYGVGRIDGVDIAANTLFSLLVSALLGAAGGIAWLAVWDVVRRFPATGFTTVALAFILYGVAEMLGFSGPIAALVLGITLANHSRLRLDRLFKRKAFTGINEAEKNFFEEIVFLLKTFFFLYLGIVMTFDHWGLRVVGGAVAITALVYAGRAVLCRFALPKTTSKTEAALVSFMAPKGLVAAVLALLPAEAGLPGAEMVTRYVYAIILASIVMTALLVMLMRVPLFLRMAQSTFPKFEEDPAEGAVVVATGTTVVTMGAEIVAVEETVEVFEKPPQPPV